MCTSAYLWSYPSLRESFIYRSSVEQCLLIQARAFASYTILPRTSLRWLLLKVFDLFLRARTRLLRSQYPFCSTLDPLFSPTCVCVSNSESKVCWYFRFEYVSLPAIKPLGKFYLAMIRTRVPCVVLVDLLAHYQIRLPVIKSF